MKRYVVISLLLIFFLSLGGVCASDGISEDVLSEDNLEIMGKTIADADSQDSMENDDLDEKIILEKNQGMF